MIEAVGFGCEVISVLMECVILECGDLSPLWRSRPVETRTFAIETEERGIKPLRNRSGDRSPHSKGLTPAYHIWLIRRFFSGAAL